MLTTLILAAALDLPPMPPATPRTIALSPKATELKASLGSPMVKLATPVPMLVPTGFVITNITVQNGTVSLSWQMGQPLFQVEGEPSMLGPWNNVGNLTTARTKTFSAGINQFWRISQSNSLPLNLNSNSQPRLTWTIPELDMSDTLQPFTVQKSTDNGATYNTITTVPASGPYQLTDTTTPPVRYRVLETTANGVVVPYVDATLSSSVLAGVLTINQNRFIQPRLTWTAPDTGTDTIMLWTLWKKSTPWASATEIPSLTPGWTKFAEIGSVNPGDHPWDARYYSDITAVPTWYGLEGFTASGARIRYDNKVLALTTGIPSVQRMFGKTNTAPTGSGFQDPYASGSISTGVTVDRLGNIIICGRLYGQAVFGDGQAALNASGYPPSVSSPDAVIAKYSADGTCQWSKNYGLQSSDTGYSVVTDSLNNIYFLCSINGGQDPGILDFGTGPVQMYGRSDAVLFKFSSAGTLAPGWPKVLGGTGGDEGTLLAIDSSDNIYLAGTHAFFGTGLNLTQVGGPVLSPIYGQQDIFLVKLNSSGVYQWGKSFGGTNSDKATAICVAHDGNILLGMFCFGNADLGGGVIAIQDASHGDSFLAKYSSANGSLLWTGSGGNPAIQQYAGMTIQTIQVDTGGNIYCSGTIGGNTTGKLSDGIQVPTYLDRGLYVEKLTAAAGFTWKYFAGADFNGPNFVGMTVTSDGVVRLVGTTGQSPVNFTGLAEDLLIGDGNPDLYVVHLLANGTADWSWKAITSIGSSASAGPCCLDVDGSNMIVVVSGSSLIVPPVAYTILTSGSDNKYSWIRIPKN